MLEDATDAVTEAYEPVTNLRTKFTAYCGKSCARDAGSISGHRPRGRFHTHLGVEELPRNTRTEGFLLEIDLGSDLPFRKLDEFRCANVGETFFARPL